MQRKTKTKDEEKKIIQQNNTRKTKDIAKRTLPSSG